MFLWRAPDLAVFTTIFFSIHSTDSTLMLYSAKGQVTKKTKQNYTKQWNES